MGRPRRSQRALAALTSGLVMLLCGCAPAAPREIRLSVGPSSALYDHPLSIRVSGAAPGAALTLGMTARSADGTAWSSRASFRAGRDGSATTDQAPVSGDYRGARRMGLLEALHPPGGAQKAFTVGAADPIRLTVSAIVGGRSVARATVVRQPCSTMTTSSPATLGKQHVLGTLYEPRDAPTSPRPAVVVVGGSEGGLSTTSRACLLAARGFPALAVAYFHAPGLPSDLQRIPLEYFERAAKLLARAPNVDPRRIVVWGTSRGSEAALLTAADFPDTVAAAIGSVPSSMAMPGLPSDIPAPAWTLGGRGVATAIDPFADSTTAIGTIPVERIAGPILLICGGRDLVWTSCPYSTLIQRRAREHGKTAVTVLAYPNAGHAVGGGIPDFPSVLTSGTTSDGIDLAGGGTALAANAGRNDSWARVVQWLTDLPH